MKVRKLKKILEMCNPDWDVMIKCDEASRDLIADYTYYVCGDNSVIGFIELKSCNYIGFGSQEESEQVNKIRRALHKENFDEDDFSAEVAHILGEVIV